MYVIIIDPALCVDCGNCERRLPGLHSKATNNQLLVNEDNSAVDFVAVFRAIGDCLTEALSIRRFNG
jgi:ferredoxin